MPSCATALADSLKTLLMNAALGAGSELIIDVAAGVDWTAAIAVVYGIQQVLRRPSAWRGRLSPVIRDVAPMAG